MSGFYYKVTPEPEKAKFIGLKKVGKAELKDIVSRLTTPTYNRHVESKVPHKARNNSHMKSTLPPHSAPSCSKPAHGLQLEHLGVTRKLTDQELQKMFRRIQKPTRSYLSSRNYERNERELSRVTPCVTSHPSTAYERVKAFQHLRRPTTASRGKHATECHLCLDDERELNKTPVPFEYYYADDKIVSKEVVNCIVSRLMTPQEEATTCSRLSPDYNSLYVQSVRLPLVSGLARSKNVADIVNRLYTKEGERGKTKYHGYMTQSTQISYAQ